MKFEAETHAVPGVTHGATGLRCGEVPALGGLRQQATPGDPPAAHALGGIRAASFGPCARAAVALQQRRPQQPLILLQGEHAHEAVQSGIITGPSLCELDVRKGSGRPTNEDARLYAEQIEAHK